MAYITKDGKWLAYRDATQEIMGGVSKSMLALNESIIDIKEH